MRLLVCSICAGTELAAMADLHLRPRPGELVLLAGIIRLVLASERHDRDFAALHVEGVEQLTVAVAPFTDDEVAERTGVIPAELHTAAELLDIEPSRRYVGGHGGRT